MTGTHMVEECAECDQWRPWRAVWKEWKEALGGRAVSKKERGIYFVFSFSTTATVIHNPSVPARYTIKFVRPSSVISHLASPVIAPVVMSPVILLLFPPFPHKSYVL